MPEADLADLHDRLDRVRLPNWIDDIGWEQGIEQDTYRRLLAIRVSRGHVNCFDACPFPLAERRPGVMRK